ncbi:MAG: hypothetical protein RL026_1200 [Pseudomonadota bacterium]
MSIMRWEPFGAIDDIFGRWPRLQLPKSIESKLEWSPSANISESDSEYLIRAELPAVKKDDIKVSVHDGIVTLQGERRQKTEEKSEKLHRVESVYGSFSRSFSLPENADAAAIRCETQDGVLTVRIPKTKKSSSQPRQIPVE